MVDIINPLVNNYQNQFAINGEFANGMPLVEQSRKINPPLQLNNLNRYDEKSYNKKRYHPANAPSIGSSSEAVLKARELFEKVFIHNEAATRYSMISMISSKSQDIRNNYFRFA